MLVFAAVPALASHQDDEVDFDSNGFFVGNDFDEDESVDAPVSQSFEQEAQSGDVSQSYSVSNSGDNSNICAPALQFSNTGNLQNAQGFVQYGTETDDIEFSGSSFVFKPELAASCDQSIQQAAAVYR